MLHDTFKEIVKGVVTIAELQRYGSMSAKVIRQSMLVRATRQATDAHALLSMA